MLHAGLSFWLAPAAKGQPPEPWAGFERGEPPGASLEASGVLVQGCAGGVLRTASRAVTLAAARRDRLLALASCLAECAMDLGLGTGIYRRWPHRDPS